jgi:protein disulfide-isomerase-like protein
MLLLFYVPWCSHSKEFMPEFEAAALHLAKVNPPVTLAKVDASKEESILNDYKVTGFPTVYFLKENGNVAYNGEGTQEALVEWIRRRMHNPSLVATCELIHAKVDAGNVVQVYFGHLDH